MDRWTVGLGVVVACLAGCGEEESTDPSAVGTGMDGMADSGNGDDSDDSDDSDQGSGEDEGDDDGSGTETGTLPEGPGVPMSGSCGWDGAANACGYEQQGPLCPNDLVPGELCQSAVSCCTATGALAYCGCDENACDPVWNVVDCESSANAGTCGWNAGAAGYTCGGEGTDPAGLEMACADTMAGDHCDDTPGATCCDANGDAKACTRAPNDGGWQWGWPTDCVFDE